MNETNNSENKKTSKNEKKIVKICSGTPYKLVVAHQGGLTLAHRSVSSGALAAAHHMVRHY
jgi:hypothetical protein